jgi:hypothetical protein
MKASGSLRHAIDRYRHYRETRRHLKALLRELDDLETTHPHFGDEFLKEATELRDVLRDRLK